MEIIEEKGVRYLRVVGMPSAIGVSDVTKGNSCGYDFRLSAFPNYCGDTDGDFFDFVKKGTSSEKAHTTSTAYCNSKRVNNWMCFELDAVIKVLKDFEKNFVLPRGAKRKTAFQYRITDFLQELEKLQVSESESESKYFSVANAN